MMPAPLNQDAVAYLQQQGMPVNTQTLSRTMVLLGQQPNLRPSYAAQSSQIDVDPDTMRPSITQTGALPPLQGGGGGNSSFGSAFRQARNAGLSEFEWNGRRYNTKLKEEAAPSDTPSDTPKGKSRGEAAPINQEADADGQESLAEEKSAYAASQQPAQRMKTVGAGRAGAVDVPMSDTEIADDDMNSLLDYLIPAAAGIGIAGAGVAAAKGSKQPPSYRQIAVDPTNPAIKGINEGEGLTRADIGNPKPNLINEEDEMSSMLKSAFPDESNKLFEDVVKDESYLPEERQAAQAALKKNKTMIKKLLPRIPVGKSNKALINALKALL